MRHLGRYFSFILLLSFWVPFAQADDFSSSNFTVKDPVIAEPAAYGTSSNYGLWGAIPNIAPTNGTSTNFGVNPGFLAFSSTTIPTLSATAGADSLNLSWSVAISPSVVTYEPGYATSLGGPYTFAATQTTRTATVSGLTANTAYYVIVRVKTQSGGVLLGYSNELAISTTAASESESEASTTGGSSSSSSPPLGWIYSPTGLLPITDFTLVKNVDVLLPGDSLTVNPSLFRQFGSVIITENGSEFGMVGAEVTLWRLNPETGVFELWPSEDSATINTDEFGLFSFVVPAGTYQLSVNAPGYAPYISKSMLVDSTGQFEQRIQLIKDVTEKSVPFWYRGLMLAGMGLLLLLAFWFMRARR